MYQRKYGMWQLGVTTKNFFVKLYVQSALLNADIYFFLIHM